MEPSTPRIGCRGIVSGVLHGGNTDSQEQIMKYIAGKLQMQHLENKQRPRIHVRLAENATIAPKTSCVAEYMFANSKVMLDQLVEDQAQMNCTCQSMAVHSDCKQFTMQARLLNSRTLIHPHSANLLSCIRQHDLGREALLAAAASKAKGERNETTIG